MNSNNDNNNENNNESDNDNVGNADNAGNADNTMEFFIKFADKYNIEEGPEGVLNILRIIYRNGTISTRKIARLSKIPIPVVARVLKLLEQKQFISRDRLGAQLWEHSMKYLENECGFYGYGIATCPECKGRPIYITPRTDILFDTLNPIFEKRPSVDTTLDQSKNAVETGIRRALLFYDLGALEGKKVLVLGDDDFTSISIASLYKIFFPEEPHLVASRLTVVDIDDRILESLRDAYISLELPLNKFHTMKYDCRQPLLENLKQKYDTVLLDPPYSLNGLRLFLSRAVSMLNITDKAREESNDGADKINNIGKFIFLSFAHRSPDRMHELEKIIIEMGLSIERILPRFNRYEGAEVLGNETQMMILRTTTHTHPLLSPNDEFTEPIYTGETHPYLRIYKCSECGAEIEVGPDRDFQTIEILKGNKCPQCKVSKKFELISRNIEILEDE